LEAIELIVLIMIVGINTLSFIITSFMEFLQLLDENYLIFVPVLWVIGYALKQTPFIPNWSIIWLLLFASIIIGFFAFGYSAETFIHSIIAAGVAVFGHQAIKQTIEMIRKE
jgi:Phage holin family Hol44, in holin superfamily V